MPSVVGNKKAVWAGGGMARLCAAYTTLDSVLPCTHILQTDVSRGTACQCVSVTICPHREEVGTSCLTTCRF